MNPHWIRSGRCTLYPTPPKKGFILKRILKARFMKQDLRSPMYNLVRQQEEENIVLRKMKEDKAIIDNLLKQPDNEQIKPEDFQSEEEDDLLRSRIFYKLQDMLDELDSQIANVAPAKRKLIMHKINKLAKGGVLSKEETQKYTKIYDNDNFDTHRKAVLLEKFSNTKVTLENIANDLQPMSSEEFVQLYMEKRNKPYEKARRIADGLYNKLDSEGRFMTRHQAYEIINKVEMKKMSKLIPTQENLASMDSVVVPSRFPITPFPDLADYEPSDFYDLRSGPSQPINTSRVKTQWFDASPTMKKNLYEVANSPQRMPFYQMSNDFNEMDLGKSYPSKTLDDVRRNKLHTVFQHQMKKRPRIIRPVRPTKTLKAKKNHPLR